MGFGKVLSEQTSRDVVEITGRAAKIAQKWAALGGHDHPGDWKEDILNNKFGDIEVWGVYDVKDPGYLYVDKGLEAPDKGSLVGYHPSPKEAGQWICAENEIVDSVQTDGPCLYFYRAGDE